MVSAKDCCLEAKPPPSISRTRHTGGGHYSLQANNNAHVCDAAGPNKRSRPTGLLARRSQMRVVGGPEAPLDGLLARGPAVNGVHGRSRAVRCRRPLSATLPGAALAPAPGSARHARRGDGAKLPAIPVKDRSPRSGHSHAAR